METLTLSHSPLPSGRRLSFPSAHRLSPSPPFLTLFNSPNRRLRTFKCCSLSSPPSPVDQSEKFKEAAKHGNLIPLYRSIFSDHLTPVLAYRCLVKEDDRDAPSFLFESVEPGFQASSVVPETLPSRVLEKMKAPLKANDVAEIQPEQLLEADGFIFGFPSRFGMMAAQFKAFFDATHELWATQALAGKPAGIFWSTGFHGGGQENTALTAVTQLTHHGMIYVPLGYTFGSSMFEMNEVKGGSAYGAGTYAGDGSRQPTELELQQAFHQGKYVSGIAKKLKK